MQPTVNIQSGLTIPPQDRYSSAIKRPKGKQPRFRTGHPYHSVMSRPTSFPQLSNPARYLWSPTQGQYPSMPVRWHYPGSQSSPSPDGYAPYLSANGMTYCTSSRPGYSYSPTGNWSTPSAGPIPSPGLNRYCNTVTCSVPPNDFNTIPPPQPGSFNFADSAYGSASDLFGSPCSRLTDPILTWTVLLEVWIHTRALYLVRTQMMVGLLVNLRQI